MQSTWRSIVRHRHFVPAAIIGEFRSRVVRSKIGALWFVLQPLAMALIYLVVLSEVLSARLGGTDRPGAYAVYLLAGITAWGLFGEILNRCLTMFLEYANTMKKIAFPKVFLPVVVLGSALINNLLLMVAVTCIIAFYGFFPNQDWLAIFPAMGVTILLAFGLGIFLGVLNVFARDVSQVMTVVMNVWFWLTPIVYAKSMVSQPVQNIIDLNPMTPIVNVYQSVIVGSAHPDLDSLLYPLILASCLMVASSVVFWRATPELVDAL